MGDTLSDKMEPGVRLRPASLSKTSKYWVQITWQPFDTGSAARYDVKIWNAFISHYLEKHTDVKITPTVLS